MSLWTQNITECPVSRKSGNILSVLVRECVLVRVEGRGQVSVFGSLMRTGCQGSQQSPVACTDLS